MHVHAGAVLLGGALFNISSQAHAAALLSRRRAPFRAPGTEQPSALCSQRAPSHVRVRHARAGTRDRDERAVYARTRRPPPADAGHCIMCSRCVWRVPNTHVYRDSFVHCPRPCRARTAGAGGAGGGRGRRGAGGTRRASRSRRLSSRRIAGFDKTHAGRQGERDPGENTDGGGAARRPPSLSPPSRTAVNTRSRLCAQSTLSSDRRHSPSPAHAHDHTECN